MENFGFGENQQSEVNPMALLQILQMMQLQQQGQQNQSVNSTPYAMQPGATPQATTQTTTQTTPSLYGRGGEDALGLGGHGTGNTEQSGLATQRGIDTGLTGAVGLGEDAVQNAITGGLMGYSPVEAARQGFLSNPSAIFGIGPEIGYSQAGIKGPGGFLGGLMGAAPGALAGLLGLTGPLGALAGVLGTPLADALGDVTGMRTGDVARDKLEGVMGELDGRRGYADAMSKVEDQSLMEADTTFGEKARQARTRANTFTNIDEMQRQMEAAKAYQQLSDIIGTQSTMDRTNRSISNIGNVGDSSARGNDFGGYGGIGNVGNTSYGGSGGTFGDPGPTGMSATLGEDNTSRFGDQSGVFGGFDFGGNDNDNDSGSSRDSEGNNTGGFGDRDSDTGTGGV